MAISYYTRDRDPRMIDYDERFDIMCVVFGDNSKSYEDEYDVGFGLIKDMQTDEVVGVSCYGYEEKNRKSRLLELLRSFGVSTKEIK